MNLALFPDPCMYYEALQRSCQAHATSMVIARPARYTFNVSRYKILALRTLLYHKGTLYFCKWAKINV